MSEMNFKNVDEFVNNMMLQMGIPGTGIGILIDGKTVFTKGYGYRDLEHLLPMTPDTLFGVGSISKSFAALAIMQLLEHKKIDLQDPVSKYIDYQLDHQDDHIQIHHLLSHTTGYPELWAQLTLIFRLAGGYDPLPPMNSWESFLAFINGSSSEKVADPGQKFLYNNETYALFDPIVKKVTGLSYTEYIKENILRPLQMHRSTYLKEEFENDANVITGYLTLKGKLVPNSIPFNIFSNPSGGLISSINELINYIKALMKDGYFSNYSKKMWTPQIKIEDKTKEGIYSHYGYGWFILNNFFGYDLICHGGDYLVSGGEVSIIPEKKMGVVVSMNKQPGPAAQSIARGILALLLGKEFNDANPLFIKLGKLKMITGKYQSYKGLLKVDLFLEAGMLMMKAYLPEMQGGIVTFPLIPKDLDKLQFTIPVIGNEMSVDVINMEPEKNKVSIIVDRYVLHKV